MAKNRRSPRSKSKAINEPGYNNWLFGSPKMNTDVKVIADPHFLQCYLLEADSKCAQYTVESEKETWHAGERVQVRLDCETVSEDRVIEFIETKAHDLHGAAANAVDQEQERRHALVAAAHGAKYVRVYRATFEEQRIWLAAVKFGVAAINAARYHSLTLTNTKLFALLSSRTEWTAEELIHQFDRSELGLFQASLFSAIFAGQIRTDLRTKPWSRHTLLSVQSYAARVQVGQVRTAAPVPAPDLEIDALIREAAAIAEVPDPHAPVPEPAAEWPSLTEPLPKTRATIPHDLQDHGKWPTLSEHTIQEADRPRFFKYQAAIRAYLDGASGTQAAKDQGIPRSELYRQLSRCLRRHPDGYIWGWRALDAQARVELYVRTAPPPNGTFADEEETPGRAGAFMQLLAAHDTIKKHLLSLALKDKTQQKLHEPRINATDLHTAFLDDCAHAGIASYEYPFNSADQGLRSIRRFLTSARQVDFDLGARILGGNNAVTRAHTGRGQDSLIAPTLPYENVIQDGHKIDFLGSVGIPHPSGVRYVAMSRVNIEVLAEWMSKAAIGRKLVLKPAADGTSAMSAIQNALTKWTPPQYELPEVPFPQGSGLPSGVIPELEGAAWSCLLVDSASIYTTDQMLHRTRSRVGCAINVGPTGDFTRRYIIEGIFGVLEKRGFQRMPSTTGSHPRDTRRENAELHAKKIPYEELEYLVDVAIATYNNSPLPSLGHRSPLQYLRELFSGPSAQLIPRYLPPLPPGVPDINILVVETHIRGNQAEGRRPYVEFREVHYTNGLIAATAKLIGVSVVAHVKIDDLRSFEIFIKGKGSLGHLVAQEGWSRIKHDIQLRRAINRLKSQGKLFREPGEDWVQAYIRRKGAEGLASLGKTKVSPAAAHAAHAAHEAGISILTESPPSRELLPLKPQPDNTPAVPTTKRRARY